MKVVTRSLMAVLGLLVALPLMAQEPQAGERPREHVVRDGDTLWDLAIHYFSNPFGWRRIYEANTRVVEDPHWIYPEEVIIIPGLFDPEDPTPAPAVAMRPMDRPTRTAFFREPIRGNDDHPTVLTEADDFVLPVKPGEFHRAEFVADPADLQVLARMIRPSRSVSLSARENRASAHPGDVLYLGYASTERPAPGTRLLMVRPGEEVEALGDDARIIHPTAVLRVVAHNEDVMEAQIEEQFGRVLLDQLVIPRAMFPDFLAEAPTAVEGEDLEGEVVRFVNEEPLHGDADRGFIDLGRRDGVKVGDVFIAYLDARRSRRRDPGELGRYIESLPPETVAELRIVRVGEDHATFAVDRVVLPLLEDGIKVRRIRRMP